MSSPTAGTSSLGDLYGLLDPAFDTEPTTTTTTTTTTSEKPASSTKRLMNDDEDEDEEIDVEEDSEEEYEYESPSTNNNNNNNTKHKSPPITTNYSSPRRRTRSCAVPDVLKTKEVVTLDDLMKHGFLRPGDALEFSGLDSTIETGILVKDGWIEYGTDKFPDMDAWIVRVFKDHKRRRKHADCWETVSARGHALSYYRDQFLNKMNNRVNYNERKKRLREEKKKTAGHKPRHQVPGRSRLVQQESQPNHNTNNKNNNNNNNNDDEDEEVLIDDDEPDSKEIVLPHKKRKANYHKHEPANGEKLPSSSSSVDLLGEMSAPNPLLREDTELLPDAYEILAKKAKTSRNENASSWLGKRKKDDASENPSTPPQAQPQKETEASPLSRRRTETQAQEFDDGEENNQALGPRFPSPPEEKEEEEKHEEGEEKEEDDDTRDNDETRDEDEDQTHDSLAPAHHEEMPQPPSGKLQVLQHITSPSHSSSSTNASSSSSDLQPWVAQQTGKSNFPQTPMDSSDMGSFAARLDEHEKEVETLSGRTKQTKQTSPPPPAKPTNTPSKPTNAPSKPAPNISPKSPTTPSKSPTAPSKSSATPSKSLATPAKITPSMPTKSTSKPTPSIPLSSNSTPKTQSSHPPKFTLPPSAESVSPVTSPTPSTPVTPATSSVSSFTTPSSARKPVQHAQPVVFTPAKPTASTQSLPVSPSATCKDGKERTILTTGLRSDMLCTLQALMAQLGGRTVDEFDDAQSSQRVTHVVTGLTAGDDTHRAQRTLKYCCGVLCGAWIVSFEWVLESLAAREWVEESDFELRGDTHGAGAPKKARIALRKGSQRLFNGLRFCFAGDFTQPSRKDLQRVARIGGADILTTPPSPTTTMPEYLEEVKHTHVIIDPERTDAAAAQELHLVCGLVPLSYHWLLDSVSHYVIQPFDKYRIVVQEEGRGYETQQSLEF